MRRTIAGSPMLLFLLAACAAEVTQDTVITLPPTAGVFDYQLGGSYDVLETPAGSREIDVVVRDATEAPLPGAYSICYVNGFQTQPAEAEFWLDRPDVLVRDQRGEPVVDPDWPDEFILDPSSADQREAILATLEPVLAGCAEAGFDAVEIDNLDTWTRFDAIDATGAQALARAYVDAAHQAGLAIAQKNSAEVAEQARTELGFDFAITEECAVFAECDAYRRAYGDQVLQIEYPEALDAAGISFAEVCADRDRAPLAILRDRDLVTPGGDQYVWQSCDEP